MPVTDLGLHSPKQTKMGGKPAFAGVGHLSPFSCEKGENHDTKNHLNGSFSWWKQHEFRLHKNYQDNSKVIKSHGYMDAVMKTAFI